MNTSALPMHSYSLFVVFSSMFKEICKLLLRNFASRSGPARNPRLETRDSWATFRGISGSVLAGNHRLELEITHAWESLGGFSGSVEFPRNV